MYKVSDERVNEMRSLVHQLITSTEYDQTMMQKLEDSASFNPLRYSIAVLNSMMVTVEKHLDGDEHKRIIYEVNALVDHLFIPKLVSLQSALGRDLRTEDVYALVSEHAGIEIRPEIGNFEE